MKVEVVPIPDVNLLILKIVKLSVDDKDEDDGAEDEGVTASAGLYCMDSQGGLWKKLSLASDLLLGFDFADPQLTRERVEAHKRRKSKPKLKTRRVK